jgi:hypothetical protein
MRFGQAHAMAVLTLIATQTLPLLTGHTVKGTNQDLRRSFPAIGFSLLIFVFYPRLGVFGYIVL